MLGEGKEAAAGRTVGSGAGVAVFRFFILGVVLTACRSHPVHQPTKTIYGGRFRLEIPTEFTLRGEGGQVKGVELIGVTLPAGPSLAAARDAFWKDHIAEVRRQYAAELVPYEPRSAARRGGTSCLRFSKKTSFVPVSPSWSIWDTTRTTSPTRRCSPTRGGGSS